MLSRLFFFILGLFYCLSYLVACNREVNEEPVYIEPVCIATQSHCQVTTVLGDVFVLFNVESVRTETPFEIVLSSDIFNEEIALSAYLEGKDMYMGKIPLFFTRENESSHQPSFKADALLGSCAEEKMQWRMWVTVENKTIGKVKTSARFFIDFESQRH